MTEFSKGKTFTSHELMAICNRDVEKRRHVSEDDIDNWAKRGMLSPRQIGGKRHFSFLDVVKAKVAASLRAAKQKPSRLSKKDRAAVSRLGGLLQRADTSGGHLSDITIFTEGLRIVFETDKYKMDGSTGQLLFRFEKAADDAPKEEGFGRVVGSAG